MRPAQGPPGYAIEYGALMPASRDLLPARPDGSQQFALAGVSISKNGHNHHRQDFGVRVQGVEMFIRADLIEHVFANSQIVGAEAGAVEALTRHFGANLSGPAARRVAEAMECSSDNIVDSVLR
jgi:hypothetical protein